jgi:shikimate kinase
MGAPPIIVMGPPGAGKSSTARALAEIVRGVVIDTDLLIEEACGKTISEIFTEEGEPYFRKEEEQAVLRALEQSLVQPKIIALGGGAVLSELTRNRLRESHGTIVYLKVSIAFAAPRIGFNRDRPLLVDNPRAQWVALLKERAGIYESLADLTIDTDNKSARDVATEISVKLSETRAKS